MLDDHNGNKLWAESIAKEMNGLDNLKCFRYHHAGWRAPPSHQYAPLRIIFDIKQDLRRKSRLVCGGHVIDAGGLPTCASTVKAESVRLLFIIAVANSYDILCGDVGNAFVMANTPEKTCCRAGPEFGE